LPAILIIEDEPAIADTLVYALKTEGFAPEWCATGRAGLTMLAARSFALVIADLAAVLSLSSASPMTRDISQRSFIL